MRVILFTLLWEEVEEGEADFEPGSRLGPPSLTEVEVVHGGDSYHHSHA